MARQRLSWASSPNQRVLAVPGLVATVLTAQLHQDIHTRGWRGCKARRLALISRSVSDPPVGRIHDWLRHTLLITLLVSLPTREAMERGRAVSADVPLWSLLGQSGRVTPSYWPAAHNNEFWDGGLTIRSWSANRGSGTFGSSFSEDLLLRTQTLWRSSSLPDPYH
jgi:hypothetical protein